MPEPWRTWRESGLEFLLQEPGASREQTPAAGPAAGPVAEPETAPVAEPVAQPPVPIRNGAAPPIEAVPEWPEPWKSQLGRVQRKKPVVWTYLELGHDLCGQPDRLRRALWGSIIDKLNWPKGAVVFWPFSRLSGERLDIRPDLFWKGIALIDPSLIVLFGDQTLRVLLPDAIPAFGPFRSADHACLYLPGPGDMLPDNRQAKLVVWEYLRHVSF